MKPSELEVLMYSELAERFNPLGYTLRSKPIESFELKVSEGFYHICTPAFSYRPHRFTLVIGARHNLIAKIASKAAKEASISTGRKKPVYPTEFAAAVTRNIGYLLPRPRWKEWYLSSDNLKERAEEAFSIFNKYAQPYLDKLATLDDLVKATRDDHIVTSFQRPLILAWSGDIAGAKEYFENYPNATSSEYKKILLRHNFFIDEYTIS